MSWLTDYVEYTASQESPEEFHFWVGLSTIAATVNRRVWLDRRQFGVTHYRVYPGQLIVIFVAGSSHMRKSACFEHGLALMKEAGVFIIAGRASTEKLIHKIAGRSAGAITTTTPTVGGGTRVVVGPGEAVFTIASDELSNFLTKKTYAEDIIDLMIHLYDAKTGDFTFAKMSGDVTISNPCLTALLATTPESLAEALPTRAHSSGFLSRVFAIYSEDISRCSALVDVDDTECTPEEMARMRFLHTTLTARLKQFAALSGPAIFPHDARAWFRTWYEAWRRSPDNQGPGYPGRRHDHMLRVALNIAISEGWVKDGRPILTVDSLTIADTLLRKIELGFPLAYQAIGNSASGKNQDRVLHFIIKNGGKATSEELCKGLRRFFANNQELKSCLEILWRSGEVRVANAGGEDEYWYVVTSKRAPVAPSE